jgi:hypothetical protein
VIHISQAAFKYLMDTRDVCMKVVRDVREESINIADKFIIHLKDDGLHKEIYLLEKQHVTDLVQPCRKVHVEEVFDIRCVIILSFLL